jgi:hypothetical protein
MSDNITQIVERWTEKDRTMSDSLQASPTQIASKPALDRTMLDRIILQPSPDVQGTSMEGETVLLDLSTGRYYTLNRLGSVIWEHCTGHTTISDIHAVLCNRFDVAPERALDDLVALANQLVQEGLLQQERR